VATRPLIEKSTDQLLVDCEVASEIYAEYIAFCAKELAEEKEAKFPNEGKVEALESQIRELKREKLSITVDNYAVINKALYVYAPLLKKRALS
jgi:hypothetical protein